MVLKRCVFGVDKNPMAVELAKVALWLHTLTAGVLLSFLDHHLKCGDLLFGEWVRPVMDGVGKFAAACFINSAIQKAEGAARGMDVIEEADRRRYGGGRAVARGISGNRGAHRPALEGVSGLWRVLKWMEITPEQRQALDVLLFDGSSATRSWSPPGPASARRAERGGGASCLRHWGPSRPAFPRRSQGERARLCACARPHLKRAHALAAEERFLRWQIAFPRVWTRWTDLWAAWRL